MLNRYEEKSHVRYRSRHAQITKLKVDLYNASQIIIQIHGQIGRVDLNYLLDPKRKEERLEVHSYDLLYRSNCWDHNIDDFKQISEFHLAILA